MSYAGYLSRSTKPKKSKHTHWTELKRYAHLHPHLDMLRPEGLARVAYNKDTGLPATETKHYVVYDFLYVLKELPELRASIPEELQSRPGTEDYLSALRVALEQYLTEKEANMATWADVIIYIRRRFKMSNEEFAALVTKDKVTRSSIAAWQNGAIPKDETHVRLVAMFLKKNGGAEMVKKLTKLLTNSYLQHIRL